MEKLTTSEIKIVLESLQYTKLKFESIPIGNNEGLSYEFKKQKVKEIEVIIEKIKKR